MSWCHICKAMWDNDDCYNRVYSNTDCSIRVSMTALLEYIDPIEYIRFQHICLLKFNRFEFEYL